MLKYHIQYTKYQPLEASKLLGPKWCVCPCTTLKGIGPATSISTPRTSHLIYVHMSTLNMTDLMLQFDEECENRFKKICL